MDTFYCICQFYAKKEKSDHTNLFSSNECEKNDKIILKYFQ